MNGRIYDPLLGRFLSADVQVQYPERLQNFNRYSYVDNNPLTRTDPSGFGFFDSEWMRKHFDFFGESNVSPGQPVQRINANDARVALVDAVVVEGSKQVVAAAIAQGEGAAKAAVDSTVGLAIIVSPEGQIRSIYNMATGKELTPSPGMSFLLVAKDSAEKGISGVTTKMIIAAGADPSGPGRAVGELTGYAEFTVTTMIVAPENLLLKGESAGAKVFFAELKQAEREGVSLAHIGGAPRDCVANAASWLSYFSGGDADAAQGVLRLRAYLATGANVSDVKSAVPLIEQATGLVAGSPVRWAEAPVGRYAVFTTDHVVYGEVNAAGRFTYDSQKSALVSKGVGEIGEDAVAVPFNGIRKPN